MSNVKSSKRKSLGLSTVLLMGGALLATGAVAPAANAATPERAPIAATQIHEGNLQNVSVGTYLRVENKSNQPITVQLSGNYKVNNVVQPGGHVDCKGNGSDDDVHGRITFADGTSLPIYANNPTIAECYGQIGGHRWHGSGGASIESKRFHADWKGNWKDSDGHTWKDWALTFQGVN